jgi:hypothetical protein
MARKAHQMTDFAVSTGAAVTDPPVVDGGYVRGTPKTLLRLEGATVLVCATFAFSEVSGNWLQYALLFFVPDISMLAYLFGRRTGTTLYNVAHSYLAPAILILCGHLGDLPLALSAGLIWIAHIGFDRAAGYGLKYGTAFADTHLGRVGRSR